MRRVRWGAMAVAVLVSGFGLAGPADATDGPVTFGAEPPAPPAADPDRAVYFGTNDDSRAAGAETRAITVNPDTDLVDGQVVTVEGTGFGGDPVTGIIPCATGLGLDGCDPDAVDIFEPEGDGTFSVQYAVDPILHTVAGDIDCRSHPRGCHLSANDHYSLVGSANATITFDPDAPLQPPPTVRVDPSTDLVDGQVLQVDASGLEPGEYADIGQCPADFTNPLSECANLWSAPADADGSLSTPYQVEAAFTTYDVIDGVPTPTATTTDCRVEVCVLAVAPSRDIERYGTASLAFDPDAPLRPDMAITVTPNVELVDGQTVRADLVGYTPDGPVTVVECSINSSTDGARCELDEAQQLTADADGSLTTTYVVHDTLETEAGTVDCLHETCILVGVDRSVPIAFGRGYVFEDLDFAGTVRPPVPDPIPEPVPMTPRFTG